ncbi:uncharacterized protein LOC123534055 [Mercenaria mercenaria]|uniref:uncharacterized protein LOC123534055 n=1 Tax=Mercenaria mercenaria TaxID=6596 RepID=UPI001E1D8670|nr:uncharacterized protein LOC123534055 [Mercenaria mercenaria]
MRLTQLLRVYFPRKKNIPGLKYAGKNQMVKPVITSKKTAAVDKMMRTEQNLQYINNPYLSAEEERVYGMDHPKKEKRKRAFLESKRKPFFLDKTLEDHYKDTVYQNKKWE